MLRAAELVFLVALSSACSGPAGSVPPTPPVSPTSAAPSTSAVPPAAIADLAPTGKLRVEINYANSTLASRDPNTGELSGVTVDLARELARRMGVAIELLPEGDAFKLVDAIKEKRVDIAFFAIDPQRGVDTDYTAAYLLMAGVYVVPQASPIKTNADVDKPGTRIAVVARSAFDLFLTREIKQATIVRASPGATLVDTFLAQNLEVVAGPKPALEKVIQHDPGLRMLDGGFMQLEQAMATPKGRDAGLKYLRAFVEEMKASGFVARALERHHVEGVVVAPPAPN